MPTLKIVRRWGSNQPGATVNVDDEAQARWLVDNHFAEPGQGDGSATAGSVAPGSDGPDPRAGGDRTRLRPITERKVERHEGQIGPVAGAPRQFNQGVRADDPTQVRVSPDGKRSRPAREGGDGGDMKARSEGGEGDSGNAPAPARKASRKTSA